MRLADLAPLTTLPIEQIRGALAAADSCCVLPVTGGRPPHDHVLAATPSGLAIVRRAGRHSQPKVVVRWERWSRVSFACEVERPAGEENEFDLVIRVGHRAFRALLSGPSGQRALRDFVVAAQRCARGAATKMQPAVAPGTEAGVSARPLASLEASRSGRDRPLPGPGTGGHHD